MVGQTKVGLFPAFFSVVALSLFGGSTAGSETEKGWDRIVLTAGVFDPNLDSSIRVDPASSGSGTQISLESDLNLEDSDTVPYVSALWRITERFGLEASYFQLHRSSNATLNLEIDFGDEIFLVDTDVVSEFDSEFAELSLRYSFILTEKIDLSASLGAYYLSLNTNIQEVGTGRGQESSTDAPLPVVGVAFKYKFIPAVTLFIDGKYFDIDVDEVDGSVTNFGAGLQWDPIKYLGVGLAYEYFELDVETGGNNFDGAANLQYDGPVAYLAMRF